MVILFVIAGALLGVWFAAGSEEMLGVGAGALLGYLVLRVARLESRLRDLEKGQARREHGAEASKEKTSARRELPPAGRPVSLYEPVPDDEVTAAPEEALPAEKPAPAASRWPRPESPAPATAARAAEEPSLADRALDAAKDWLTTGNVPVKLGVLVSFFGVSFLLKYAVDRQLIVVPIELRYLLVAAAAIAVLALGWRLRERMRTYALSLQGGGIGTLYLTIFAAFRLHPLLPASLAFFLLVMLTVSTGILAVAQNARWLAILGTVGGFLAPVLVSTGAGNHVALFSYYLLLNGAILYTAWHRAWRTLNLLGFFFTFGVGTMWGYEYYRPALFWSTEPFLIAFFVFYQAIAILSAHRQPPNLRGLVDGTLIFGTPVIAFALQSKLVEGTEYGLAISAIVLAIAYVLTGVWLHRQRGPEMRLLTESFVALAVAFATIAVPLALDDRWTAVAWALEGAALTWVGVRQNGLLAKLAGTVLVFASGIAFISDGWIFDQGWPFINANFLGALLVAVASLFSAYRLHADRQPLPLQGWVSVALLVWGLGWWSAAGGIEILDRIMGDAKLHLLVAYGAASAALLAWLAGRTEWPAARVATLAWLPAAWMMGQGYLYEFEHFFVGAGTLSWFAAIAAHFYVLRRYDGGRGRLESAWHYAGALLSVAVFAIEIHWRLQEAGLADVWKTSAALLVALLTAAAAGRLRERAGWPLQRYWTAYLAAAATLTGVALLVLFGAGIDNSGAPAPLPYLPLLNPFDALTLAALFVALDLVRTAKSTTEWFGEDAWRIAIYAWAFAAFVLSTLAVIRGVHLLGNIDWRPGSLVQATAVQTALSIYWAILGLGGMIHGARRARRSIWIAGTTLMAIVVVKLFLVDLGNTGTIARIVSFLGVGGMLLVVGYYAPAPPRRRVTEKENPDAA